MKRLWVLVGFLCCGLSAQAELSLKEIRTASNNVLVAYFKSTVIHADEVNTADVSAWKLNGQPVTAINKFVTEADACDHHIYLQVPTLVNGTSYTLQTPHGDTTFVFDDQKIFCESIKTNQNAYSGLSKVRYANFAIWLGDGGSQQISGDLPAYTVFKMATGATVAQGTLQRDRTGRLVGRFRVPHRLVGRSRRRALQDRRQRLRLLLSLRRGRRFLASARLCVFPLAVSPALRLPDQGALCLEHQDQAVSHDDLPGQRTHRRGPPGRDREMSPPSPLTAAITMPAMPTAAPTTWMCRHAADDLRGVPQPVSRMTSSTSPTSSTPSTTSWARATRFPTSSTRPSGARCSGNTCRSLPARSTGAPRRSGIRPSRPTTRRPSASARRCSIRGRRALPPGCSCTWPASSNPTSRTAPRSCRSTRTWPSRPPAIRFGPRTSSTMPSRSTC